MEDHLTGNVFGALRYIPFSAAFGKVLAERVYTPSLGEEIRKIDFDFRADKVEFWPYDREGEIDALIEFENAILVC